MVSGVETGRESWQTKPSDRFILKWIKIHLSARITQKLLPWIWLDPWMVTVFSAVLGTAAGVVFALGWAWLAGCIAAASQILDGVDGQLARLKGRQTNAGAFWDSLLDRYSDGSMVIGLVVYLCRSPVALPFWPVLALGALALIGSNLISYSSARAQNLGIDLGQPTLASKGTRMTVMIVCAWGSLFWPPLPVAALVYLAGHTQLVVFHRLIRAHRQTRRFYKQQSE
jgi:phosphatidylglycerophosphate synthase